MTQSKREKLIAFIKAKDTTYNYNGVNFKFYSDRDLLTLKKRIEWLRGKKRWSVTRGGGMQASAAA
jgi:hypothetical protein